MATYTFDVCTSLDGFDAAGGDRQGCWGKQDPELLDHRLALYREPQRLVLGAGTYRAFVGMLADPMVNLPTTVVSNSLRERLDRPDAS